MSLDHLIKLTFVCCLLSDVFWSCLAEESVMRTLSSNESPKPLSFRSEKEFQNMKDECKKQKENLMKIQQWITTPKIASVSSTLTPLWMQNYSTSCIQIDNMQYSNMTVDEVMMWISSSNGAPDVLNKVLNDFSIDKLKEILQAGINNQYAMDPQLLAALNDIAGRIIKKLGDIKTIKVSDVAFLGASLAYILPSDAYQQMSDDVFKYVLDIIFNETGKMRAYEIARQMNQDMEDSMAPPFDRHAISTSMLDNKEDLAKIKTICRRTFTMYANQDLQTDIGWNRTVYLMFCAPPNVCKALNNDKVLAKYDDLSFQPWPCPNNIPPSFYQMRIVDQMFSSAKVCGKNIIEKLFVSDVQPYVFTAESVNRLNILGICLDETRQMQALDVLGCATLQNIIAGNLLSKRVVSYVTKKCLVLPTDLTNINCSFIKNQFGPFLGSFPKEFFQNLTQNILCDGICMDAFKENQDMQRPTLDYIMKTCYSNDAVIDSNTVNQLGGLVTGLPIQKFREISTTDIANNLDAIKKSLDSTTVNPTIRNEIAKKMLEAGKLKDIAENKELLKGISIKEMKNAVTNIVADLGLDGNTTIALTDSQNKWVMSEILKTKDLSNFTVDDLRSHKSLVKGFTSSDIKNMSVAQSNSSDGMDMAKIMCQQTDWPMKPLKAINRDLIVGSLTVRNSTYPMASLTLVDVSTLGCECLMFFTVVELQVMSKDVCSAVCQKVGFCNNFKCLNPTLRKNFLQGCMACKGLGTNLMSNTDIDELGPNLISQLSRAQLTTLVPNTVLKSRIQFLKDMCMAQDIRMAISNILISIYGSSGSSYDRDTMILLGSAIALLPSTIQQQLNKTYLAEMADSILADLIPKLDSEMKLKACCERWLPKTDLDNLKLQRFTLMYNLKIALSSTTTKVKRATGTWTCNDIKSLGEIFTTALPSEITAMANSEFLLCLHDIGLLSSWTLDLKATLLNKTKVALQVNSVCSMLHNIVNLGVIAQAMSTSDANCIPLNDSSVVSMLGSLSGWSSPILKTLSQRALAASATPSLSMFDASTVSTFGSLMCGFNSSQLASINATVFDSSSSLLGHLSDCGIEQLTAFKIKAIATYGAVSTWTSGIVSELNFINAALNASELPLLSTSAIEGLSPDVIHKIDPLALKAMTVNQLNSFTDAQAVSVTTVQLAVLSTSQKTILTTKATDGQKEVAEITAVIRTSNCARHGLLTLTSIFWVLCVILFARA